MMIRRLAIAMFLVAIWAGRRVCGLAGDKPDGQRWWSHVLVLADDQLEGRGTGSPGHRKAAEYWRESSSGPGSNPPGPRGTCSQSG